MGKVERLRVGGTMYVALPVVIFMELEGENKGLKFKSRSQNVKGVKFYMRVDPSPIVSELPVSTSFGVMRVLLYALHNIPSY